MPTPAEIDRTTGVRTPTTTAAPATRDWWKPTTSPPYIHGGSTFYQGNSPTQQAMGQDMLATYKSYLSGGAPKWPVTQPTTTGGGGGGGGGGGSAPVDYGAWGGWAASARPGTLQYNPREWDPSQYNTARQGVASGIADARAIGSTAFDRQLAEYRAMINPYNQGPRTTNPGVDPRLLASMQAWGGAGSGGAAQAAGEGVQADQAMGSVYDLLARGQDQYQQGLMRSTSGDRMQLDQRLGGEERMLGLGVEMAQARAKAALDQENWNRRNTVDDTNVATGNAWNQSMLNTILSMIQSGGTNIPQPGNSLSDLIMMSRGGA